MPLEFCTECKTMHYRTDPCRPIKHESTKLERIIPKQAESDDISKPVVRSNTKLQPGSEGLGNPGREVTVHSPVATSPKRGRPRTILDMKAYKATKEREYRARKKAIK